MPGTGFALGAISSPDLPFGSSAMESHHFQEFPLALLVKWSWKTCSEVGEAVSQLLAWLWEH